MRLLCLFLLATVSIARADLLLTEFLASNDSGLTDQDGATSDWIEIHNTGPLAVNLAGWHLTDDPDLLTKWTFPSVTLGADAYRTVFASSKNRAPTNGELHTNFNLSKDGEYLALVEPDGTTVAFEYAPAFPAQSADISYGLRIPGLAEIFFTTPTPGQANNAGFEGYVGNVVTDHERGLYDAPFQLALSSETPSATIRYTTDGTEPTLDHGTTYNTAIPINTTTILRTVAFRDGYLPSEVVTSTFIFLSDVVNQPANPAGFPSSWQGTRPVTR